MDYEILTDSVEQTMGVGRRVGAQLKGGEIICFEGELGSGKTTLIKGIVKGADAIESDLVNSPTFVLVNEYAGRIDFYHIDAYRLETAEQLDALGFDDFVSPGAVVMIEWADKVKEALQRQKCVWIRMEHAGANRRRIRFENLPSDITI